MDNLSIIQNTPFSTSFVSPIDASTLYTVDSGRHSDGSWADVVYRNERDVERSPDASGGYRTRTELATVFYVDAGTTRVRFAGGQDEKEREGELNLDAFLRRRKAYSNSRIFVGVDGKTYKWRINGERLELFNTATQVLIARSHPRPTSKFGLSIPLTRLKHAQTQAIPLPSLKSTTPSSHTTLFLHPALLDADSTSDAAPQLLDAIVLTFIIMQRLLRERLRFRYP